MKACRVLLITVLLLVVSLPAIGAQDAKEFEETIRLSRSTTLLFHRE